MGNLLYSNHECETITFERLAEIIREAKYVVALTGAGISAQSGIPTFRDPNDGIWKKYDAATYATIWGFWLHPEKIWELMRDTLQEINPVPNAGHYALARLESKGYLKKIITQNVDNLHQLAGSTQVIEYHGNLMEACCTQCKQMLPLSRDMFKDANFTSRFPPRCSCGGTMKPNAVLFGERIPSSQCNAALAEVQKCDVLLVIGTSCTVTPASNLPYKAKRCGAKVIEINIQDTPLTMRWSDMIIRESASGLTTTASILCQEEFSSRTESALTQP